MSTDPSSLDLFCFLSKSRSSGFSIYDFGAEEQAQGDAVAAQVESPAAVFYNPAGVADLGGTHLEVGTSILSSRITFQSDVSNTDTNIHPGPFFPSYLFMKKELSSPWSIGLGIFSSIGNNVEYPKEWEGRFFLTSAKLAQLNFSPIVAYKISEKFSIGAGLVIIYATMKGEGSGYPLSIYSSERGGNEDPPEKFDAGLLHCDGAGQDRRLSVS